MNLPSPVQNVIIKTIEGEILPAFFMPRCSQDTKTTLGTFVCGYSFTDKVKDILHDMDAFSISGHDYILSTDKSNEVISWKPYPTFDD